MSERQDPFTASAEAILNAASTVSAMSPELRRFLDRHQDVVNDRVPKHLRVAQRIPVPINLAREMGLC